MPLLEAHDLLVRYGAVTAVNSVDLSVDAGEVCVVLGTNGAGKTSSLRAVCGLAKDRSGTVSLDGVDISRWPTFKIARAGLTMVPEGRRVFAPLSVEDNLHLGGYSNHSRARRDAVLADVFATFPRLAERRSGRAGLLSGGEQQMLAFGRAMMCEPKVILMDEPSMGLAPSMVDVIMESIRSVAERGIGILMVEQNATAALDVADTAVVIERGSVVLRGTAAAVAHDPNVARVFLGGSDVLGGAEELFAQPEAGPGSTAGAPR